MPKANVWLQFQYCTCVCWCFFNVCSPNLVALVLGFFWCNFKTSCTQILLWIYIYIYYMCIHLVWGYNLVWGYCIANQNHCMTTNLCLGFLFWKHTAFNQTQTMVGTTCLSKNQATITFVFYLIFLNEKNTYKE